MDAFAEVTQMVLGDSAISLISKVAADEQQKQRKQALVALGGNVIGLGAGAAALATAGKNPALKTKTATKEHAGPVTSRLLRHHQKLPGKARAYLSTPKGKARLIQAGAAAGVGLQAANTVGDVAGNIVLRREAAKKGKGYTEPKVAALKETKKQTYDRVQKMEPGGSDVSSMRGDRGKLKRLKTLNGTPMLGGKVLTATKTKVDDPLKKNAGPQDDSITWEGEFSKVNTEKRQVFGWASITEINGEPVVDLQGDYIDHEELEKSAYDYVIKSRKGGDMHQRYMEGPVHVSDMIESFIVTPEKKEKMGLPDSLPTGWWVGYQINDEDAWDLVKTGKRTGFSIHGRGQRTPMEI